jgi:hypothetical protein
MRLYVLVIGVVFAKPLRLEAPRLHENVSSQSYGTFVSFLVRTQLTLVFVSGQRFMPLQTASVEKVTSTYKTLLAHGFGERGKGWSMV